MNRENIEGILGTYHAKQLSRAEVYRLEHIYYVLDTLGKESITIPSLSEKEREVLWLEGYCYEETDNKFIIRKNGYVANSDNN